MTELEYTYTDIKDLKNETSSHVIGIIKYFEEPKQSRGKDLKMTISITDPSIGYDQRLTCNIFCEKRENFPKITSRGDVILIHRLKIGTFGNKPQGTGIRKAGFATAIISQSDGSKLSDCTYENVNELMRIDTGSFRLSRSDFQKVQDLMIWGSDMPLSEPEEINLENIRFRTLSDIGVDETVSLAVQVISVYALEAYPFKSILIVWDATKPNFNLNKDFLDVLPAASSATHCNRLMVKFRGKLTDPYLIAVMFTESLSELKDYHILPGDYIYMNRVTVSEQCPGTGVTLTGNHFCIGPWPKECPQRLHLKDRANYLSNRAPCVAQCISNDLSTLQSLTLQECSNVLDRLEGADSASPTSYTCKIMATVADLVPTCYAHFNKSLIELCMSCDGIMPSPIESWISLSTTPSMTRPTVLLAPKLTTQLPSKPILSLSLDDRVEEVTVTGDPCMTIQVPSVTLLLEDFTGYLTATLIGRSVLNLTKIVMPEVSDPKWWAQVVETNNVVLLYQWMNHLDRMRLGWIEAKLSVRRGSDGQLMTSLEDAVLLDQ